MRHIKAFEPLPEKLPSEYEEYQEEILAAIGSVSVAFSILEDALSSCIAVLLNLDPIVGSIVTAEMSFRNKVHLMASLTRHFLPTRAFNTNGIDPIELLDDLVAASFKAEELRNQISHSTWGICRGSTIAERLKITAKAHRGRHVRFEGIRSADLTHIFVYILDVAHHVDDFFDNHGRSPLPH